MSTKAQPQEHDDKTANKGTFLFTQPPTDGVISPAIRKSLSQNNHKNNSNSPLPQKLSSTKNQHPKLLRKITDTENPKLLLSMPRKNSEETLPTSRPSREDSRHKNLNKKGFSLTLSGILSK